MREGCAFVCVCVRERDCVYLCVCLFVCVCAHARESEWGWIGQVGRSIAHPLEVALLLVGEVGHQRSEAEVPLDVPGLLVRVEQRLIVPGHRTVQHVNQLA
jgi:hypothetical protein